MSDPQPYSWTPSMNLMLEEGRRSIDSQQRQLEGLRTRAGSLFTYAGAIAGLFLTLSDNRSWATVAAIAAVVTVAGTAGFILMPRTLNVDLNVQKIDAWFDAAEGNDHITRSAAYAHWQDYLTNKDHIELLSKVYFAGICAIGAEVLFFSLGTVIC